MEKIAAIADLKLISLHYQALERGSHISGLCQPAQKSILQVEKRDLTLQSILVLHANCSWDEQFTYHQIFSYFGP